MYYIYFILLFVSVLYIANSNLYYICYAFSLSIILYYIYFMLLIGVL